MEASGGAGRAEIRGVASWRAEREGSRGAGWLYPAGGVGSRLSRCDRGQLCRLPCLQYQPRPTEGGHGKIETLGKSDTMLLRSLCPPAKSAPPWTDCLHRDCLSSSQDRSDLNRSLGRENFILSPSVLFHDTADKWSREQLHTLLFLTYLCRLIDGLWGGVRLRAVIWIDCQNNGVCRRVQT